MRYWCILDIHVKTSACYTIMQTLVYFISICFISIYKVTVHQIRSPDHPIHYP